MVMLSLCLLAGTASAERAARTKAPDKSAAKASAKPLVWIGVFHPQIAAHDPWTNDKLTSVAKGGSVRVLSPSDGSAAATGDVVVVHPLLDKIATGVVANGTVALTDFAYDQRDGDDGVLVFPAGTKATVVAPSKDDVAQVRARVARNDALSGVRKALVGLEVGTVDIDGDGKADYAVTYGCSQWADGHCQSRGQFFLAKRGGRWVDLD
jgi:hypothetical protein